MNIFYAVRDAIKDNLRAFASISGSKKTEKSVQKENIPSAENSPDPKLASEKTAIQLEKLQEVAFEKERKEFQAISEKLGNDFSETVKRMNLVETDLVDTKELLRQEKESLVEIKEQLRQEQEKNEAFQNTVNDQDETITQVRADLKLAQSAPVTTRKKSTSKP